MAKEPNKDLFKTTNGNEILIGLDIFNRWTVSCWTNEMEFLWSEPYSSETKARERFDELKNNRK